MINARKKYTDFYNTRLTLERADKIKDKEKHGTSNAEKSTSVLKSNDMPKQNLYSRKTDKEMTFPSV